MLYRLINNKVIQMAPSLVSLGFLSFNKSMLTKNHLYMEVYHLKHMILEVKKYLKNKRYHS